MRAELEAAPPSALAPRARRPPLLCPPHLCRELAAARPVRAAQLRGFEEGGGEEINLPGEIMLMKNKFDWSWDVPHTHTHARWRPAKQIKSQAFTSPKIPRSRC